MRHTNPLSPVARGTIMIGMKRTLLGLAVALVVLAPSAADAQNRREMQMMADIRMLQEQNQQLQVALTQLGDALKVLNSRLDDQGNANRKGFADSNLKVDQFATDLRVVRERVDETNVRIASLSQEVEALRLSIPQYQPCVPTAPDPSTNPNAATPAVPGSPGTPGPGTTPPPTTPPPPPTPLGPGMSPQRLYDTAWADYTSGQWDLCVSGFDTYLRTFPKSELADEAQFYIGECNYSGGKHQEAIQAYTQVITVYPRGQSVGPAYYKRGLAFENLKQLDRARESFEAVLKNFPDSDAARLAKQALDRVNKGKG
jgi:tol-pal system protein YbgF